MSENTYGVLLCDDLIFTSRVTGAAKALGLALRTFKTARELLAFAKQAPPRCVILDLQTPGLAIGTFVADLREFAPTATLVGYGSHVDTATLKSAREAGCDVVWPRSKFAEELATALPSWYDPANGT
jgi:DNA-binding NarL/FixJ family response regulator